MIHLVLIIDRLNQGGAERQFIELAASLNRERFAISVVVLHPGGDLRSEIESRDDIRIITIPRESISHAPAFMVNLYLVLRKIRPDILFGFMGGTNEICLVMAKLVRAKSVWGIRSSDMDLSLYGWRSRFLFRLGALLSPYADLIIVNSYAGRNYHTSCGYASGNMAVVHNGIDTDMFSPDASTGTFFRKELGVPDTAILIGHVGRIDPMKDHRTFLQAASLLAGRRTDVRFVCVGKGEPSRMGELADLSERLGLGSILSWAGARSDMTAVYNGIDILTSSSSFGEGFPNVIGEAMACGRVCVVTDVGDSSLIVGESGEVVPPRDPHALVGAWEKVLALSLEDRMARGEAARKRIQDKFTTAHLVRNTSEHLLAVVERGV
ncbi:MAG: glycosyltransferase [Desulfomonilia bacterium]|nr:glycosyltransferase [Desulfomonilia bacterium]